MSDGYTDSGDETRAEWQIDSPMSVLAAAVAAQDGACLICRDAPARYCGPACVGEDVGRPQPGECAAGCGDPPLYCSWTCAVRGR